MKVLNCANCGGDLNYKFDSPVAVCQYCDSVNVFDNFNIKIDTSNLDTNYPTNVVRDKFMMSMRQPQHYIPLVKHHQKNK